MCNIRFTGGVIRYSEGVSLRYSEGASISYRALRIFRERGGYLFLSILFGMYKQTLKFSDPNISKPEF